ncbi:hypothetical protein SAY87_009670 [Trapa incisa]|uniref:Uncharacterized protein n=1 Tax=Trapa incisa TaxID=236973 RepID=A0AAN7PYD0_9MYRT|nr:hypothetical protein SAY87_009670 [Trapa incisa]
MADKPSRALVLFGDGLAPAIRSEHIHLHSLAAKALCGFLSLPYAPPSEIDDERVVREFALLIDAFDPSLISGNLENQEKQSNFLISERFMGMRAALFSDHPSLASFAARLGFTVMGLSKGGQEVTSYLGFVGGKAPESHFDVVFLHAGEGEELDYDIGYLNNLVGNILQEAQCRSEIGSSLHLSVVMSYGKVPADLVKDISIPRPRPPCQGGSNLSSKLIPRQSYTLRGEDPRENVRHNHPMLVAQWQNAVTRRDAVQSFSFHDFKEVYVRTSSTHS